MPPQTVFPQICIALGFDEVEALLEHARAEYEAGERFLEFRLDYLASPERGVQAIRKFLMRQSECMILATCRRRQNQGRFHGSVEEQIAVAALPPSASLRLFITTLPTRTGMAGFQSVFFKITDPPNPGSALAHLTAQYASACPAAKLGRTFKRRSILDLKEWEYPIWFS